MTRTIAAALLTALLSSSPTQAQVPVARPAQPPAGGVILEDPDNAHEIRMQLQRLLRQYPPAVGEVLMRDPSLLDRADYLTPYPALVAFLTKHPEISRNPGFFFGTFQFREQDPKERAFEMLGIMLGGLAALAGFAAFMALLVWSIRAVIDHRRWLRLSRVQTEVHSKLMDRMTTNDDLLAYMQSPAGRRFLESTPIAIDGEARQVSAPLGRILWSLQAGIVLVALGIGFWFAQRNVLEEVAEGFYVLGVVAIALGAGFAVSGLAAYFISARLGLMSAPRT
jgi:hypothetical protein